MLLALGEARSIVYAVVRTLAMPIGDIVSAILIKRGVSVTGSGVLLTGCSVW
jgi:hypothetical protein